MIAKNLKTKSATTSTRRYALTQTAEWQALLNHSKTLKNSHLLQLCQQDEQRFNKFSLHCGELILDFSKNFLTRETLELFSKLTKKIGLTTQIKNLFSGQAINQTEQRAALHTALRNLDHDAPCAQETIIAATVEQNLEKLAQFCAAIHSGHWRGFTQQPITDIVNIGIGGSYLGPALAAEALANYSLNKVRCHFISHVHTAYNEQILQLLNPATTLFIISSKSFTTQETLLNANWAKHWFLQASAAPQAVAQHFVAITHNVAAAESFGLPQTNIFSVPDWVGGRYSLWSAIGLPVILSIGMQNFKALLAGARAMDQHFYQARPEQNMPVLLALLSIWYNDFFNCQSHAILPYDPCLKRLPAYLQQLEMESNGKQVDRNGDIVAYPTSPVLWGEVGCEGQHAFFQFFHQGTQLVPIDFIVTLPNTKPDHANLFNYASCLGQSEALLQGKTLAQAQTELLAKGYSPTQAEQFAPYHVMPGNRPSTTLVMQQLNPYNFGSLLALYEHKVFVQSAVWHINPFDQWGVELGKTLTNRLLPELLSGTCPDHHDASTRGLMALLSLNRQDAAS